jgi:hypothetical protein
MSGGEWTTSYGDLGQNPARVGIGNDNAVWFRSGVPGPVEVTVTCKTCGHAVTVCQGDAPIPHGDPRLCAHLT